VLIDPVQVKGKKGWFFNIWTHVSFVNEEWRGARNFSWTSYSL
jgi:hypothetical protein